MNRDLMVGVVLGLIVSPGLAEAGNPVTVTKEGWTITADGEQGMVSIAHGRLGAVLQEIRLHLLGGRGLITLTYWSIEKTGQNRLSIRTANPPTGWVFDLGSNTVKVSCTSSIAVLTARAPASEERVVARLMDPLGVPVSWVGTDEVVHNYGGRETHNRSFLPRRNPEVMYLGLGQVSGSEFHSLFDRKTDTAISFSEQTRLERNQGNEDVLDLTMPVPGNALVHLVPDYYTKTLGVPFYVPFDDTYFSTAPMVWSSWTSYYSEVTENDIVRNTFPFKA